MKYVSKTCALMMVSIALLLFIGFRIQYSSAGGNWKPFARHQLWTLALSMPCAAIASCVRIETYIKFAYKIYLGALCSLMLISVCGVSAMGATRWLNIGGISVQPSEFAKIALILALARYCHGRNPHRVTDLNGLIGGMLITVPLVVLVFKQPNFGTASLMFCIAMMIMCVAVVNVRHLIMFVGLMLGVSPLMWYLLHDYQKSRILSFLHPQQDPLGMGYNTMQSQIAIGSGGMYGQGFVNGSQAQLGFLPEKQTDFVFSVFSEEYGFMGSMILFCLYGMLINAGLRIALNAHCRFSKLVAVGVSMFFLLHFFVNVGMVTGVLPVVGVPLPLLSYGGSVMLTSMILVGVLVSIDLESRRANIWA